MVRIAVCDDHPLLREGLKRILLRQSDFCVDVEVGSGAELLAEAERQRFDVIILDISLPDMSGLDVLKGLQASGNSAKVLMLSMHPEEQYAVRALKAGAAGYLQKESVPEELINAVQRVSEGRKYVTASLAEKLAVDVGDRSGRSPHELLSDREYQVLCLLASGKGVKDIAGELGLSSPTVATYRARILSKIGLTTTVELVRYALEHKLVE